MEPASNSPAPKAGDETPKAPGRPLGEDDLGGENQDDPLFRAQMALADFVIGYWRVLLAALFAVLALIAVHGLYTDYEVSSQQETQARVHKALRALPPEDPMAALMGQPAGDSADLAAKQGTAAQELAAVAADSSGVGAAYAWAEAADAYTKAGKADEALAAWQAGATVDAKGALGWRIASGLANALLAKKDVDGATAALRTFADKGEGVISEQALFMVGRVLLEAGRKPEAVQVFEQFDQRFPNSTLKDQVAAAKTEAAG